MKKYFTLCVILIIVIACSSDSGGNDSGVLIKEINSKTVNYDGTEMNTIYKYTYNGNKISMLSYGSYILTFERFTYTGDLITKITDGDVGGNYVSMEYQYSYDVQNRLIRETTVSHSNLPNDLKVYTYNQDGSVIRESYHNTTVNPTDLYETIKFYTDSSNRFIRLETFNGANWTLKNEVTYSNYNSPFKNIVGYDKLYPLLDAKNGFGTYKNYTNTSTYQYSVNSANYPYRRVEKYKSANGGTFWTMTNTYSY